jgi:hypothetical protein
MCHRENHLIIWTTVPEVYEDAQGIRYLGDIPVAAFNKTTQKWEAVDNPRGRAYGARSRMKYRKRKKKKN